MTNGLISASDSVSTDSISATLSLVSQNSLQEYIILRSAAGFDKLLLETLTLTSFINPTRVSFWNRRAFSLNRFNHDNLENAKSFEGLLVIHARAARWSPFSRFLQNISLIRVAGGIWSLWVKCFHVASRGPSWQTSRIHVLHDVITIWIYKGHKQRRILSSIPQHLLASFFLFLIVSVRKPKRRAFSTHLLLTILHQAEPDTTQADAKNHPQNHYGELKN